MEKQNFIGYKKGSPYVVFDNVKNFKEEADDYGYIHVTFSDADGNYEYVGNEGRYAEINAKAPLIESYKAPIKNVSSTISESFNDAEEKEFQELCAKLGLENFRDITNAVRKYNPRDDKDILAALRKEAQNLDENPEPKYIEFLKNHNLSQEDIDILTKDLHFFSEPEEDDIDESDLSEMIANIRDEALSELHQVVDKIDELPAEELPAMPFGRYTELVNIIKKLSGQSIKEDLFKDIEKADKDAENTAEDSIPETFEGKMDYLAADEQEAIDGYKKIIETVDDDFVKEQLNKIIIEEEAHKAYLEKVKEDKSVEYTEPLEPEDEDKE